MVRRAALLLIGLCAIGFCRANSEAIVDDSDSVIKDAYKGCGHTKTCYGIPVGCVESKKCEQLIAYAATDKDGRIPIELYGTAPNTTYADNFWVGFGASASGAMADTAVVQCVHYSNGSNNVVAAYNSDMHQYNSLPDYQVGIHRVGHSFHKGFVRCRFRLDVQRNVSGNVFDLKNPYTLLLGSGWVNETAANTYELKWHLQKPFVSTQKIIFAFEPDYPEVDIDEDDSDSTPEDIYKGCGHSKTCYGIPVGCVESKKCEQLIAYAATDKDGRIPIELYGTAPNTTYADNFWVGFGASASGAMADTAVVQCVHYSNGSNNVVAAYNSDMHQYNSLPDYRVGIHRVGHSFHKGFVRCRFRLDVQRNVSGNVFDLKNPYTLLLGSGWVNETAANTYELKWHLQKPFVSTQKIIFAFEPDYPQVEIDEEDLESVLEDAYKGCGHSRICYGIPSGCVESKKCQQLIAYAATDKDGRIPIELYGTAPNTTYADNFWVGFGASASGAMADTAVVQCVHYSNGSNNVVAAYNSDMHQYNSLPDYRVGIHRVGHSFHKGFVRCRFRLDVQRNVSGNVFDLKNPYTLLLGSGWVNETAANTYELKWHLQKPFVSTQKIIFAFGPDYPEVEEDIYGNCGNSRQCFGVPENCLSSKSCASVLSYGATQDGETVAVDLYGTAPKPEYSNNFWIGFGLSQGGMMEKTAVLQCAQFSDGSSDVVAAYNPPNTPSASNTYMPLVDKHLGITEIKTKFDGGYVRCSFNLDMKRNVSGVIYDLSTPYFVLLGSGWINATSNELMWHIEHPSVVAERQVLSCGNQCQPAACLAGKCFGVPRTCQQDGKCDLLLTWKNVEKNANVIQVQLIGGPPNVTYANNFWIGFGVTPGDTGNKMSNTAVVQCVRYPNDTNALVAAYNLPTIPPATRRYKFEILEDDHYGISQENISFTDGRLSCDFQLDVQRTINGTLFDLTDQLYIMVGSGWIQTLNESTNSYEHRKHLKTPEVSSEKIALSCDKHCNDVYDECGVSRKCFGVPENCIASKSCTSLLSYGATQGSSSIPVDLYGVAPKPEYSNNFWIGFGLSEQGLMEKTAVVQCAQYANGSTDVVAAYNPANHTYTPLSERHLGITGISTTIVDGYVRCSFNLDAKRSINDATYDLSKPYYVLLGSGWVNATSGELEWHIGKPATVATQQVLACGNQCPPVGCATGQCFGVPRSCEQNGDCEILVTWNVVPNNTDVIQVQLSGGPPNVTFANNFWIGFAVTPGDVGNKMANAAVVECARYPNDTNVLVAAYNFPVIAPDNERYHFEILSDSHYGISQENISFTDGRLSCAFLLNVNRTIFNASFDLKEYLYIMAGSGWVMTNETTGAYKHRKHVHTPLVSNQRLALACVTNCSEPIPPPPPSNGTGVFAYPKDCLQNNNCKMLVSYGMSKTNNSRVAFTLSGVPDSGFNGLFWVGVGLAPKQSMDFSYVMECVAWQNGDGVQRDIFASYNDGKNDNTRVGINGLYMTKTSFENGRLECQFESDMLHVVSSDVVPVGANNTFDLTQSQYLLLAMGPLKSGNTKDVHTQKTYSSAPVVPASGGNAPPAEVNATLKKTHAILMVLAWNFFAAIGIFMARQTKDMWPDRQPFGLKVWFVVHRAVMVLAATLSIAGIAVIFVDAAQWRDIPHAYLGIITFALAMVQPFIALFRPHPGTPNRPYFNYFHWTVGYSTHLLSAVAMYLGSGLGAIGSDETGYVKYAGYIMIGCFVENFLLQVGLEIYRKSRKNTTEYRTESTEHLNATETTRVVTKTTVATEPLLPEDNVRKTILGVNWFLITAGTAAIIALIAVA